MSDESRNYNFSTGIYNAKQWEALMGLSSDVNLIQSWAYGEAKVKTGNWEVERGLITDENGNAVGACQAFVRQIRFLGDAFVWINRGPIALSEKISSEHYREMLMALVRYYVDKRRLYVRIAPMWKERVSGQEWFDTCGLTKTNTRGWSSAIVDLQLPVNAIRAQLHGKWRNALVRAEKSEIQVRDGDDEVLFRIFLEGYSKHLEQRGLEGGINKKLLIALKSTFSSGSNLHVLIAFLEDQAVGGMAIAKYAGMAEYLAGFNIGKGRKLNVGQLLMWTAIKRFQARSYIRLDLGGLDKVLTPGGIYQFKKRIGGQPYQLVNEMESKTPNLLGWFVRHRVRRAREPGEGLV